MNNTLYSKRTKLADVIASDSKILSILQRLKINLGFGDSTVEEVCSNYNLSTELFLNICNIYSFGDYTPDIHALQGKDIAHITGYLRASHTYYKEVCFPAIHSKIHFLVKELDDLSRKLIDKFYDDYDSEVINHFRYEESVVFPYVESLLAGKADNGEFSISKFQENHSNIGEKLNDLKNIIMKYLPSQYTTALSFEILNDMYAVENDLYKHSLIENRLLVPLVEKLEQQR